jgi:N-dimethylarginine dimethylaminohydrolase
MKKVLMCPPDHFDVVYDINPWMSSNKNFVDKDKAKQQWNLLYAMIRSCAEVELIQQDRFLPDMVFTANAGFQFDGKNVVLSNFKYSERKGEEELFSNWFEFGDYNVHRVSKSFEGQGDMLRDADGYIWLGTGFRTDIEVIDELQSLMGEWIQPLNLVDPRWYHLDTCFCPLPHGELLWYPNAFDSESQDLIYDFYEDTIEVSEEDALRFACNSVCILDNVFTPHCSRNTSLMLMKYGYNHVEVEMSEFLKSGGAAKCLVMDLN